MTIPAVDPGLLDFAVLLAERAGLLTLEQFRSTQLHIELKDDGSVVTAADHAAERLLREGIHERFPDDTVLGEEFGTTEGSSGRRWVIDPIDGTEAFAHGVGLYSNLLYLEDEHGPALGVINIPALGEIVAAGRGLGCTWNGQPCRVSERTELAGGLATTSSFDHWDADMLANLHRSGMRMKTWGDGYGYVMVATGRADIMVDPVIKYWDIAPCRVILPEAGGRFSGFDGTDGEHHDTALGSNGSLHDAALAMLTA